MCIRDRGQEDRHHDRRVPQLTGLVEREHERCGGVQVDREGQRDERQPLCELLPALAGDEHPEIEECQHHVGGCGATGVDEDRRDIRSREELVGSPGSDQVGEVAQKREHHENAGLKHGESRQRPELLGPEEVHAGVDDETAGRESDVVHVVGEPHAPREVVALGHYTGALCHEDDPRCDAETRDDGEYRDERPVLAPGTSKSTDIEVDADEPFYTGARGGGVGHLTHPTYQIIGSVPASSLSRKTRRVLSRIETSLSGSLRSPNFRAPTGQASTQAVVLPFLVRWTQNVHFSTTNAFSSSGTTGLSSSFGTCGRIQLKWRAP